MRSVLCSREFKDLSAAIAVLQQIVMNWSSTLEKWDANHLELKTENNFIKLNEWGEPVKGAQESISGDQEAVGSEIYIE